MKLENKLEKYKFYRLYDMDLEMALKNISVLKRYKRKDVRYPLLRDTIVTYARLFTESKGYHIKKDNFGVKFKSQKMKQLHNNLITIRQQLFAHTDLTYKTPKIFNWSTDSYKSFPMSFKGFDYEMIENNLDEIESLIKFVHCQLREKIRKFEKCF